jgi:hypothetical protein
VPSGYPSFIKQLWYAALSRGEPNEEACREQSFRTLRFQKLTFIAWNGSRGWAQLKGTCTHVFC